MKFKLRPGKGASIAYNFLFFSGLIVSLFSCSWGEDIESLVEPDPDEFTVLYSDTATVQISTVITDSVMTGGPSRMLIGRFSDPYFGKVQASTFFQPTLSSGITLPENAVYDSLVLILPYDTYSEGDTTKVLNLTAHRLLEDILTKSAYYQTNTTPFDPSPIGSAKLVPSPRRGTEIRMKLSNTLGTQLFEKAKSNQITSNTDWINLVQGFLVKPASTDVGAVVGISSANTRVQLHYHVPDVESVRRDSTVISTSSSYNQILTDRSGTPTANLPVSHRISQPSSKTGDMTFIQSGLGLMTRVDFPTVRDLRNVQYTASNRAYLRITPPRGSITSSFRAPDTLYAYRVDRNNEFYLNSSSFPLALNSLLTGGAAMAVYTNDLVTNEQYYRLDVSAYITELLTSETGEVGGLVLIPSRTNESLSSGTPVYPWYKTNFTQKLNRLVIPSQQNSQPGVKLELFYTRIQGQ